MPGTRPLAVAVQEAWGWAVAWFAEHVLRIDPPPMLMTGSGDTHWHYVQLALIGTLALAGALAGPRSIASRARASPPRCTCGCATSSPR